MQSKIATNIEIEQTAYKRPAALHRLPATKLNAQQRNRRLKAMLDYLIVVPTLLLIWPLFLVMVGILGVEWYLRKRWGLV